MILDRVLEGRQVVVCAGAGGVGKTTVAAALGSQLAARGGRVLVLTIDPARRLAGALGLPDHGDDAHEVDLPHDGEAADGSLHAAMLDAQLTFDRLVREEAPSEAAAERILANPIYRQVSSAVAGAHEYMAMERLYELHSSGRYDVIVLDTPPSRNALDFLDAPQRMAEFFGGRLLRTLTMPYRLGGRRGARLVNFASKPFYQVADRILGTQFLQDIAEFFLNFETMYAGFVTRAHGVERLMHDRRTGFVVVTTLEGAPLREAEFFCSELTARDFHLGAMVLNRVMPDWLLDPAVATAAERVVDEVDRIAASLAAVGAPALADPVRTTRVLRTAAESFENFEVVAAREAELRAELSRLPEVVATVPTFTEDVHDVAGLWRVAEGLLAG